jgi:serine/threonine protein kinase
MVPRQAGGQTAISEVKEERFLFLDSVNLLGKGASGKVSPAYFVGDDDKIQSQPSFAVKLINLVATAKAEQYPELEIMRSLRSIDVYFSGDLICQSGERFECHVMEYFPSYKLPPMSPDPIDIQRRLNYIVSVCQQVNDLHILGIIHHDLKIDNTLIVPPDREKCRIALIDFGLSDHVYNWQTFCKTMIRSLAVLPIPLLLFKGGPFLCHFATQHGHGFYIPHQDAQEIQRCQRAGYAQEDPQMVDALVNAYANISIKIEYLSEPQYFPIETEEQIGGYKSDGYMLCNLILSLLSAGGDPLSFKKKFRAGNRLNFFEKFDTSVVGRMTFISAGYNLALRHYVLTFLNKMQEIVYVDRPPIEVILRFFNVLAQLHTHLGRDDPNSSSLEKTTRYYKILHGLAYFDEYANKTLAIKKMRALLEGEELPAVPALAAAVSGATPLDTTSEFMKWKGCVVESIDHLAHIEASKKIKLIQMLDAIRRANTQRDIKRIIATELNIMSSFFDSKPMGPNLVAEVRVITELQRLYDLTL